MPIAIYRLLGRPGALNLGQAMALSTILMVVTALAIGLIERFRVGEAGSSDGRGRTTGRPLMLEARGLSLHFGPVAALDGFGLTVADRQVVSVLGPSGCGKSTLLRVIAGLQPVDAGRCSGTASPWAAFRRTGAGSGSCSRTTRSSRT